MIKQTLVAATMALCAWGAHAELRAFYTFENNFNDVSGNGLHAIASSNGPSFSAGYEGQAVLLNGIDNFLTVGLDINPAAMPTMTWGAWASASATNPVRQVLSHDNGFFDRSIGIDSRGAIGAGYAAFSGEGVSRVDAAPATADWTFLAARYDNSTGAMTFWVDDASVSLTSNFNGGNTFFRIGSNPAFGEFFGGSIDNVFVFDSALSDAQIASIRVGGAAAIMPVPEPEMATLLLAGVGLVGWVAHRRKAKATANA